jgi:hypothetical protein
MDLSDRMKKYEEAARSTFPRRMPLIIRVDGKSFSKYTSHLPNKPFNRDFISIMEKVATALCANIQGAELAYSQSDEVSVLVHGYKRFSSDVWYDNQLQKIVSVSAAIASATFTASSYRLWQKSPEDIESGDITPVYFDSRAFVLPEARGVQLLHLAPAGRRPQQRADARPFAVLPQGMQREERGDHEAHVRRRRAALGEPDADHQEGSLREEELLPGQRRPAGLEGRHRHPHVRRKPRVRRRLARAGRGIGVKSTKVVWVLADIGSEKRYTPPVPHFVSCSPDDSFAMFRYVPTPDVLAAIHFGSYREAADFLHRNGSGLMSPSTTFPREATITVVVKL